MGNHAVCIPFPAQGHIRPMLKLAQLLHFNFGFHITFINTYHNHQIALSQLPSHQNNTNSLDYKAPATFRVVDIPEYVHDSSDDLSVLNSVLDNHIGPPLKEVLLKVIGGKNDESLPPVTCMISDVAMSKFTVDVADEMGITAAALETGSSCGMLGYLHHRQLIDKGIIPLKDSSCLTNGYLDMVIDWIPSLKGIHLKDMPTTIRTTDSNDKMMNCVMSSEFRALKSQAIIINTFEALEQDVLRDLSSFSPNIYPIGPLNLLVDKISGKPNNKPIGPSPIKEGVDYIQWLDSQEPNSVVYVNFGTLVTFTQEQLVELAWGLVNSYQKFFWVVRSNLVVDGGTIHLPSEIEDRVKERGLLARWCDQERVLAHPSVGGFLTHCGWNSMVESICNGVPMICWPFFAEQVTNSWYCCNVLGIGVNVIDQAITRNEVTRVVEELMEGEKGKEMSKNAAKWEKMAREAIVNLQGSSYVNMMNLVNNVLIPKCPN